MPRRYVGGVRPAPLRKDCGEASLVAVAVTGEARLPLGECGLCEGVEGKERAFAEAGESLEDCASAMVGSGISLLDIFLNAETCVSGSITVRSSSLVDLLDIEYCLRSG